MIIEIRDPVCGMVVGEMRPGEEIQHHTQTDRYCEACWRPFYSDLKQGQYQGKTYYFCSYGCKTAFEIAPERFLKAQRTR